MRLLLRGLSHIATFDDEERELRDADILVDGRRIEAIGPGLPADGVDRVIDGRGLLALPGLINAHQHLYEAAARTPVGLERAPMEPTLDGSQAMLMERWRAGHFGPETVRDVASCVLLQSLLGGTTTVAGQHNFFPRGRADPYVEATIEAAAEIGVRLHACRGTTTRTRANGGTVDDAFVEDVDSVIAHCEDLISRFHDPRPYAKTRVALAPIGINADIPEIFDAFSAIAEDHAEVRLHTHLYQRVDVALAQERSGTTPLGFLERHGWATDRTWVAHLIDPPQEELPSIAAAGMGVVHIPASDLRMGRGMGRLRPLLASGIRLGFATSGPASNASSNMLGDLRLAFLAQRVWDAPSDWPTARELFRMATRGSADCLGRPDLGRLQVGCAADVACWDLTSVDRIGVQDPVGGLLLTGLSSVAMLVLVDGEILVEGCRPTRTEAAEVARRANRALHMTGDRGSA